jgi:hypothetical protein
VFARAGLAHSRERKWTLRRVCTGRGEAFGERSSRHTPRFEYFPYFPVNRGAKVFRRFGGILRGHRMTKPVSHTSQAIVMTHTRERPGDICSWANEQEKAHARSIPTPYRGVLYRSRRLRPCSCRHASQPGRIGTVCNNLPSGEKVWTTFPAVTSDFGLGAACLLRYQSASALRRSA